MNCGKYQIYNQFEQQKLSNLKVSESKIKQAKANNSTANFAILIFYFFPSRKGQGKSEGQERSEADTGEKYFTDCKSAWNAVIAMLCTTLPQKSAKTK